MKKLLTGLAIILAVAVVAPVFAENANVAPDKGEKVEKQRRERPERKDRKRGGMQEREVNADQMIASIEERKTRILERIATVYDKLNKRLAGFDEKIVKLSTRMEKLRSEKPEEKGSGKPAMSEEQLKERKENVTKRYNEIKKNIETRKTQILERMDGVRGNVMKRVAQLPEADQEKVKTAFENAFSQVKSEAEKLEKEAREKAEATYQKLMGI
ncbi:MAG: hypothetical protein CVV41_22200 [Candidatus Riflebacteria bacterium HGW-Riflebacteria-1]|jgi:uncharacterized phage infection (PIP) family protein YhgE|nr:MAG: hypothetical protein CVV41_22200 [Candidatus Riflebacteria bacterium HGW-Riflebacteria-1]